jgi:hypothetical protein
MSDDDKKKLNQDADPVIQVEADEKTNAPAVQKDDPTVFHPSKHRGGISIGAGPDVPNLSPGGSVEIKR